MEHLREMGLVLFRGLGIGASLSTCIDLWGIGRSLPNMLKASQNVFFFFGSSVFISSRGTNTKSSVNFESNTKLCTMIV